jgi:DNA-binding NarL/FixJ family response regulator
MLIAPTQVVTVLLVDDHAVVREGYRRLLERHEHITVVGEAADAESAYARFCELKPNMVVMDLTLPGVSGLHAMRRMLAHRPTTRVLMFSMHEEAIFARHALRAGAYGYVTKASAPTVLLEAVRAIAADEKYLSADVSRDLALRNILGDETSTDGLSPREFDVLRLLVQGRSVPQIAGLIGLTPKTVANHQSAIRQKLGADTAVDLLRKASQLGLGIPSDST